MRLDLSDGAVEWLRASRNEGKVKAREPVAADELVSAGDAGYQGEWLVLTVDGETLNVGDPPLPLSRRSAAVMPLSSVTPSSDGDGRDRNRSGQGLAGAASATHRGATFPRHPPAGALARVPHAVHLLAGGAGAVEFASTTKGAAS